MQFFYQFPQRTERLVLISSGGLGREVSPLLRGAALPGASALLCARRSPAGAGRGFDSRRAAAAARLRQGRLPAGDRAGAAAARAAGRPQGIPADAALGDRRPRPARQRPRPPLPADRYAHPDRLGRARPHDSGWRTGARPTRRSRAAASRPFPGPRTSRTSRIPRGSPLLLIDFMRPPNRGGSTTPTGAA